MRFFTAFEWQVKMNEFDDMLRYYYQNESSLTDYERLRMQVMQRQAEELWVHQGILTKPERADGFPSHKQF